LFWLAASFSSLDALPFQYCALIPGQKSLVTIRNALASMPLPVRFVLFFLQNKNYPQRILLRSLLRFHIDAFSSDGGS